MVGFCNLVGTGIAPVSKKTAVKGHFLSVAKVALRCGCAKQSKILKCIYRTCLSVSFVTISPRLHRL